MLSYLTSYRSILLLSCRLSLGLPSGFFPLSFPAPKPCTHYNLPQTCYLPALLIHAFNLLVYIHFLILYACIRG